jgi:hypothetical protein
VLYARPQFFAGQLLTEGDLQSLCDYVVAKNRLHNRYLFGDGVVCGLNVTCAPCASGHVTVNPGYALDCCGNDIVVSCPKELDINQMVRQLMLTRKEDCGDPCAGLTNQDANRASGPNSPTRSVSHGRRYYLYIDYCAQPSDPVAPYATGDTCGQATCEPTRIRESFRFELRCPEETVCDSGAARRFWKCVGDARTADRTVADRAFLNSYLPSLKGALAEVREHPVPAADESFWKQLKDYTRLLNESVDRFAEHKLKDLDEAKLRPVLDHLLDLASHAARLWLQPDPRSSREKRNGLIDEAVKALENAYGNIPVEAVEHSFHAALPRLHAAALLQLSRELVLNMPRGQEPKKAELRPAAMRVEFDLLAHHVVLNDVMLAGVTESLATMRDWLVDRLEQQQGTHCALFCEVNGPALQTSRPGAEVDTAAANSMVSAGEVLVPAVQEILRSCFCDALNPPCAPCEDVGVLLACLTVEDCKVTDICNLDRKFVITGPNLRYWFPAICRIGEALEDWCCPSCRHEREGTEVSAEPGVHKRYEESVGAALGHAPAYTRMAMSAILEPPGADYGPLEFLVPMFARGSGTSPDLQRQLQGALAEIGNLKSEHARLQERMSKFEKQKASESQR